MCVCGSVDDRIRKEERAKKMRRQGSSRSDGGTLMSAIERNSIQLQRDIIITVHTHTKVRVHVRTVRYVPKNRVSVLLPQPVRPHTPTRQP